MPKRNRELGFEKKLAQVMGILSKKTNFIEEGEKVRLNIPRIKGRPDWRAKTDDYKKFVESAEGRVFTAHLHRMSKDGFSALIELNEEPKWLFWEGDLVKVRKESGAVD